MTTDTVRRMRRNQPPLPARAAVLPVDSSGDHERFGRLGLGLLLLTIVLVALFASLLSVTAHAAAATTLQDQAGDSRPQTRPSSPPPSAPAAPDSPPTRPSRPEPTIEGYVDGDPIVKLIPKDTISPIDDPQMVSAAEAESFMRDDEMFLGVFDGRQARAYSTWHLDRHEVVNDRLSETPIAATW